MLLNTRSDPHSF